MGNFKIGQLYDEALKTMQPQDIKDNLEAVAYGVQEKSYTKNLTEEEIVERKDEYSEIAISLSEIAEQKKEIMEKFKQLVKEPKLKASMLLDAIKFKSEQKHGQLFLVDDQEDGMMYSFDTQGVCVEVRPLTKEEKQTKLKAFKSATNE
jgi:seryl-tRNA synthetase